MSNDIRPRRKRKAINFKKIALIVSIVTLILVESISVWLATNPSSTSIKLSEFYELVENNEVDSVRIVKTADTFSIVDIYGNNYSCINPKNDTFILDLMKEDINLEIQQKDLFSAVLSLILVLPMVIIMLMFTYYLASTIVGSSTKMFTLLNKKNNKVTFDDIAGISEVKEEVKSIVNNITNYKKLVENGARPCKGILLYGPPGVGKTLIAKAIANECNLPFISCSGSDFMEVFVGVGAARIRALWDLALQNAPCILFVDEIDALGCRRGGSGGEGEKNQTLNALLQRMDGLNDGSGVVVIGATNRKEDLDPALIRPGRFDRHLYIGKPRLERDKNELISLYLSNKNFDETVSIDRISKLIKDMSGAEIETALNNAVYNSFKEGREGIINIYDVDYGITSYYMNGVPVEFSSDRDRKITAIHEAGHCLMELIIGDNEVTKVTVRPYSSGVGGFTQSSVMCENHKFKFKEDYMNRLKVLLGGIAAEDIIYGNHTQGGSNDLEKATDIAISVLDTLGYSDNMVVESVLKRSDLLSNITSERLEECNKLIKDLYNSTYNTLKKNIDLLNKLSNKLMTDEIIMYPTIDMIKSF